MHHTTVYIRVQNGFTQKARDENVKKKKEKKGYFRNLKVQDNLLKFL